MKVITLWQPWATLMVLGLKKNETRHWKTNYRGLLGIHAAASEPAWAKKEVAGNDAIQRALSLNNLDFKTLPRGQILGAVKVIGMMQTEDWVYQNADDFLDKTPDEWHFGNYNVGRWAWLTEAPLCFNEPIPAKGSQGFWTYNPPEPKTKVLLPEPPTHLGQLSIF